MHLGLIDEDDGSTSSISIQFRNLMQLLYNRILEKTEVLKGIALYKDKVPMLNFLGIVHRNRFEAKSLGRVPGVVDKNSHYRKGVAGDWRNHFTDKIKREFRERHGDLLIKLQYEESTDW